MTRFMAALVGAGLGETVAVVTDGELSGLNRGITIGQIMPEAAEGGPLAIVEPGDIIEINLDQRRIDLAIPKWGELGLEVSAEEIGERLRTFLPPPRRMDTGYHRLYVDHALQADAGADFDFLVGGLGTPTPQDPF